MFQSLLHKDKYDISYKLQIFRWNIKKLSNK